MPREMKWITAVENSLNTLFSFQANTHLHPHILQTNRQWQQKQHQRRQTVPAVEIRSRAFPADKTGTKGRVSPLHKPPPRGHPQLLQGALEVSPSLAFVCGNKTSSAIFGGPGIIPFQSTTSARARTKFSVVCLQPGRPSKHSHSWAEAVPLSTVPLHHGPAEQPQETPTNHAPAVLQTFGMLRDCVWYQGFFTWTLHDFSFPWLRVLILW